MSVSLTGFEEKQHYAKYIQQCYYELLPNWYRYRLNERSYLKKNIGYALYGPSHLWHHKNPTNVARDFPSSMEYPVELQEPIDLIFNLILKYGHNDLIEFSIIYNVYMEKNTNGSWEGPTSVPIFKVKTSSSSEKILYIDINGRVYQNWKDYKENNTLPECTQILPKGGFYQSDPKQKITPRSSYVWLEIEESPAATLQAKVVEHIDTASTVLSITGIATLAASAIFTPIAPALTIAGIVTTGIHELWTLGRSSQKLVDRANHKQSLDITNKDALPAWLGVTGSALGLVTTAGRILLPAAVAKFSKCRSVSNLVLNSMLCGSIAVNGAGVIYLSYRLIDKYNDKKQIDPVDLAMLISHSLFLFNSVLSTSFARELINSSEGAIMQQLSTRSRSDRLSIEMNQANRTDQSYGSGVTRSLFIVESVQKLFKTVVQSRGVPLNVFEGLESVIININGMDLINPVIFVSEMCIRIGSQVFRDNRIASNINIKWSEMMVELKHICKNVLRKIEKRSRQTVNVDEYVLQEITEAKDPGETMNSVLKIALHILSNHSNPDKLVAYAIRFMWEYIKKNAIESHKKLNNTRATCDVNSTLGKIHERVFESREFCNTLVDSIEEYMLRTQPLSSFVQMKQPVFKVA